MASAIRNGDREVLTGDDIDENTQFFYILQQIFDGVQTKWQFLKTQCSLLLKMLVSAHTT